MRKLIFPLFFLIATPAYAQVSVEVSNEESTTTTQALLVVTSTSSTSTFEMLQGTTTEEVSGIKPISEVIDIIPGSITLTLSATPPISAENNLDLSLENSTTSSSTGLVEQEILDDGLFDLIYTGFEEFVFKVFGI